MYKIFGFRNDEYLGKVGIVEFSIPKSGTYAYLLGNFNAFNEGSFRMREQRSRWSIKIELPEGFWYYAFSIDGNYVLDPENEERANFRRISYKAEIKANIAKIYSGEKFYHYPSVSYLYSLGHYTYIRFRALKGSTKKVFFVEKKKHEMEKKATDDLFEYFEVKIPKQTKLSYYFEVHSKDGILHYGDFEVDLKEQSKKYCVPFWVFDRVFYQIMPDRFANGNPENDPKDEIRFGNISHHGGDLEGILQKISYLKELGVNALYLTPIFESMTYHGYDILDYYKVAKKFGGDTVFEEFITKMKREEIKVVLDGVFHHTSFFHPYFQDVLKNENESKYRNFYRITGFPVVSKEFLEILNSDIPWNEKYKKLKSFKWNYESFFSVWLMPRLNHDNEEVREFIKDVTHYWLRKGISGWRLDVAHGVPPKLWKEVRENLQESAYLIGEVMDDPRLWVFDKFHGTMNYPLYEAILRFFVNEEINAQEFLNWLELLSIYLGPVEYTMYNFLDNHDVDRMLGLLQDKRKYVCALVFLFTYKGIPSIYYGSEIGMDNTKGAFMERSRTPMVWDMEKWDKELFEITQELIKLRKTSKALQIGAFEPIEFKDGLLLYKRVHKDENILVGINYSKKRVAIKETPKQVLLGHLDGKYLGPFSFFIAHSL